MNHPYRTATVACIGTGLAFHLLTRPLRTKYDQMARMAIVMGRQNQQLQMQIEYLLKVLNENEIELDEFDLIVLANVMS